jgi:putative FmdB family regulatory protein
MPTYDYECLKCGKISETFHKISDPPLKECPYCKGKVKKLIGGGTGLIFKGSGFYITDYKNKDRRQSHEKPKSEIKPQNKATQKTNKK